MVDAWHASRSTSETMMRVRCLSSMGASVRYAVRRGPISRSCRVGPRDVRPPMPTKIPTKISVAGSGSQKPRRPGLCITISR